MAAHIAKRAGPEIQAFPPVCRVITDDWLMYAHNNCALDAASRAHEVTIPAVVACGELDITIKLPRSAQLADTLANATDRSLPGLRTCPTWKPRTTAAADPRLCP